MNYDTDVVNFRGRLLGSCAYFENLTFGGALIREWAFIRSFTVVQKMFLIVFCLIHILQILNISTGF